MATTKHKKTTCSGCGKVSILPNPGQKKTSLCRVCFGKLGFLDKTGQRFGSVVVLGLVSSAKKNATYRCRCDCGIEVTKTRHVLRPNKWVSCRACANAHIAETKYKPYDVGGVLLTPKEIAAIWGITTTTISRLKKQGQLTPERLAQAHLSSKRTSQCSR